MDKVMAMIHAALPAVPVGSTLVYFRRKDTKNNPVAEADKFRGIVVPHEFPPLGDTLAAITHEVFRDAVKEIFLDTAGTMLREFVDSNKEAKEVDVSLFTFERVLEKMQQQQSSQRLNQEQIFAWYDESATAKEAAKRYGSEEVGKKKYAVLREKFGSLASNNPGIMPDLAIKMLAYISTDDAEHVVCKAVAKKLERLQQVTVSADEL